MTSKFDQLVTIFNTSPTSTDVLREIILLLQQQTTESLASFTFQSFQSLLTLKHWSWQLFTQDVHQWIDQPYYQDFFHAFASFLKEIIYHYDNITVDTKASLLFPDTVDQIDSIFKQIEQNQDDSDAFITIISLWLDNHSRFLYDNPQYTVSSITVHIGQYILGNYFMNKQYKLYLTQLRQSELSLIIFTARMLFYIKTCSFYSYAYLAAKVNDFPCTGEELFEYIREDYLQIIHIHSYTIPSWNKELLGCIAHLIAFVGGCCWWNGEKRTHMKVLFPTDQIACDHVQDLVRIFDYKPFYKETKTHRSNDETALMDSVVMLLMIVVQTQNVNWLFRSNTAIRDTIVSATEAALNDEVCLCGYALLGEALTDEDLKGLKIADNISTYFYYITEQAWYNTSKTHKQVPLVYLLKAFQNLAKNDSLQEQTFRLNKVPLFIEMCDQYPVVYDIIWALSFNSDIQQQLRSSSSFMSKLAHLDKVYVDEQMRKVTHGILWNLEINHEDRPAADTKDNKSFDIMISYSHKDKDLCKQIYEELTKSGYRVWIDFDQMHGNVMDAMAQAIECSHTVIICMSEQYRKSNYCRAEAHYAFQRQRKIVPVLSQKHYKPDGWLLFLIGQLLYVDFNKYEFNRAMEMLFKELKSEDIVEIITPTVHPKEDSHHIVSMAAMPMPKQLPSTSRVSTVTYNIAEWTEAQVQQWLIEHKLIQMSQLLTDCDGRSLIYFNKYVRSCQSQQILNLLQDDSIRRINQSLSLIELSRFRSLMDRHKISLESSITSLNSEKKDF